MKNFNGEFFVNSKSLTGKLVNKDFVVELPKTKSFIKSPVFETEIADKNITIKENKLNINNASTISYSGQVVDYEK